MTWCYWTGWRSFTTINLFVAGLDLALSHSDRRRWLCPPKHVRQGKFLCCWFWPASDGSMFLGATQMTAVGCTTIYWLLPHQGTQRLACWWFMGAAVTLGVPAVGFTTKNGLLTVSISGGDRAGRQTGRFISICLFTQKSRSYMVSAYHGIMGLLTAHRNLPLCTVS